MKPYNFKAAAVAAALSYSLAAQADGWPTWEPETAAVPFAFSTDSMGFSVGVAGVLKGAGQPQAALLGAGLVTDKGTWMTYLGASNYTLGNGSRWLFGAELYAAEFKQFDYFLGDATRNDSVADDATVADAEEGQYRLSARYILPVGAAETQGLRAALRPNRPVSGNAPWNSGVTSIEFRPFYQSREFSNLEAGSVPGFSEAESVWGLETRADWDNRNNSRNPTTGSRSQFSVTYAPGSSDHASWWKWELNQSWFWDLGALGELLDQQVLAFNVYTGDTPSWNSQETVDGQEAFRRPPAYAGIRLGGLYRLRSFQSGRFVDRSALSYSMEYRVLPDWQPLEDWPVFEWYDVPWWQWVAFVDVGRVAGEYDLRELHQDMQWSAGGAIRFQVEGVVVRTEMAWGSEDSLFRVMINQPF
ncbi:BamA/TamA family outer membrane protein [Photobacterium sp. SDRW27]|uniref:BamA/TamA family outer membrane protein n=1 Tax=Photobacterium obscurum TaxID=2829490 RepID=UPI002242F7A5|nr:BamA/TamA family outer membrane protein [Photobacterium obscurum]MCW8331834.1 BamA/TamA family outer membrane protein [Photobacterium obscurum]